MPEQEGLLAGSFAAGCEDVTEAPKCRECSALLTRENTGGYRNGVPDICKRCDEDALYEAFKRFEKYEDFIQVAVRERESERCSTFMSN
jgi:hypothetical protein